ncbi:ANTAR domain-containing protein [Streptomyces sp. WAC 06783]|uniref:ANTAR domain-containing protein n=1 Tax=Streptomyces sp. WAC 06783 TaxID=2203211 RepID=UPI0021ADF617|nr:ANTAR domain-containing protein [Streptomyces sp. WAC 06783]
MPRAEIDTLFDRLRHAVRTGRGLDVLSPGAIARLLGHDALTLCLATPRGHLELVWSDDAADQLGPKLDDLQYTLGEGPTLDAARTGRTITEPDLTRTPADRWPQFLPAAATTPARAVVAIPLRLGVIPAGALTVYRIRPGPPTARQQQATERFARAALTLILRTSPARLLTGEHGTGLALHRAEVHQAAGVLAVQLRLPLDQALLRLRAHAYTHDRALLDVARDILTHRLHLNNGTA